MRKYDASIADKPSPLRPGDLLDGKYRILSVLGQGGMGTVYKARHVELGVDRAIKLMKGDVDESARFRFTREAHIAARIHFPSIATLYDVGSYEGSLFTVWEYVPGVTLGQVLRHGPVHWRVAIYVVGQVLNALVHVHRMQVLHRDVAPSNIMLYVSDQDLLEVKLIDFGIAKEALARDRDRDITSEGLFVGTPRYAAPEQLTGHGFTPAGDVYSAGVVLYQMITGTVPFEAEGHALEMVQKLTVPVRGLPHHRWIGEPEDDPPLELDPVIARALAIDPEQRYRSADEFLDELWGVASPQLTDEVEKFTRLVRSLYAGRDKPINSADQITRESAVVPAVPSLVVVADPSDIATGMFPIAKAAPQIVPASLPADDGHTLQNVRLLPLDASADSPAVRKIREGTQIGGFEVERLIGEGPRTAVFLARNPASLLDRRVVLKVPHRQRLDAKELDALRHDVKVWSFLSVQEYKGVLRLHEAARYDDLTVLVVDYFEGESLADVMKRVHANGPLPPGDAIALIRAICDALDPMHRKNLHHGNLKPANVLLVAGGVKLTDFLMRDRSVADAGNTPYLAPEVEHTAGSVRADVYAVGAMLYELLHAKTGEDDWPVSAELPYPLERLLQRCLAREPKQRFASAAELLTDPTLTNSGQDLVTRLAALIRDNAAPDDLTDILAELPARGYRGSTPDTLLLEYCLAEEPARVLDECISAPRLKRLAREMGTTDAASAEEAIAAILETLGFHRHRKPAGIGQTVAALAADVNRLPRLDDRDQILGIVTTAAGEYERVLKEIIRFHAFVVYGALYDDAVRILAGKPMGSMTMGTLRQVLQKLNGAFAAETREAAYFRSIFGRDHVVPAALLMKHDIARLRNAVIHSGNHRETPIDEMRQQAQDIVGAIHEVLAELERGRIYPRVVVVQSFQTDRFGRKYVVCTPDDGPEERIYTNVAVEPAREYFFHPTTMPVSIYPILVPRA